MNRFVAHCFTLLVIVAVANLATAGEIKLEKTKEGVTVNVDGKLFTKYVEKSGAKPILFPVLGPTGKEMTRQYPMRDALKTERDDHIHHRSLWFTHGDVNGVSFWHENNAHGHIIHTGYGKVESGDTAIIETTADWVGPDKKRVCQDKRRMVFGAGDGSRWIDFEITIVASDGDVKFGDTKEGCFGVRTAGTMKVDSKLGGKIINSRGDTDKGSWGKQAEWVDYTGPVEGETLGIAMLTHPSSFRYPSYWHVRTYGLFAANPFGLSHFKGKGNDGSHTIKSGESITMRYRVLIHKGTTEEAAIAKAFESYKATK
jgi:hypothetical protein